MDCSRNTDHTVLGWLLRRCLSLPYGSFSLWRGRLVDDAQLLEGLATTIEEVEARNRRLVAQRDAPLAVRLAHTLLNDDSDLAHVGLHQVRGEIFHAETAVEDRGAFARERVLELGAAGFARLYVLANLFPHGVEVGGAVGEGHAVRMEVPRLAEGVRLNDFEAVLVGDDARAHEYIFAAAGGRAAPVDVRLVQTGEVFDFWVEHAVPVDAYYVVVPLILMPIALAHCWCCQSCTIYGGMGEETYAECLWVLQGL